MTKKIQLISIVACFILLIVVLSVLHLIKCADFDLPMRILDGYYELDQEFATASETNMSILFDLESKTATISTVVEEDNSISSIDCDLIIYSSYRKKDICGYYMNLESDIEHPLTNKKIKIERDIISGEVIVYHGDVILALFVKDNVLSLYL